MYDLRLQIENGGDRMFNMAEMLHITIHNPNILKQD